MNHKRERHLTQGIDSGKPAPSATATKPTMGGLTHSEARARGQEAARARNAALKSKLPKRSMDLVDGVPTLYQGRLMKALLGELSAKAAIRAHCEQCVGWEDTKPRVGGCTTYACALHAYRPYQEKP